MDHTEGQGWKIGVIVFFVFTIVFAILWYVYYDKYNRELQTAAEARKNMDAAKKETNTIKQQYDALREASVGARTDADHDTVLKLIKGELSAPKLSDARKTQSPQYPSLISGLEHAQKELGREEGRSKELEQNLGKTQIDLKAVQSQYDAEKQKIEQARQTGNTERLTDVAKLQEINKQLEADVDSARNRATLAADELEKTKANLTQKLARAEQKNRELTLIVDQLREEEDAKNNIRFSAEDGAIVTVTPAGDQAYVNIGKDDGARTGLTFGIYGIDVGGNPLVLPKASIEITRILDSHRAIGKITYTDKHQKPVVPGDRIFNGVWNRGDKESVAFVGIMHLDDDNIPDNEDFRKLVNDLGGKIVAEMNMKTGQVNGRLDVHTGWLVVGDIPDLAKYEKDEVMKKLINDLTAAESVMRGQARENGVRVVNQRNFLAYMGHNAPWMTVPAGEEHNYQKHLIRRAMGRRSTPDTAGSPGGGR